jgi:hypothetical protein
MGTINSQFKKTKNKKQKTKNKKQSKYFFTTERNRNNDIGFKK